MTLIECERSIIRLLCSSLLSNQGIISLNELTLIGRIDQIIVVFVALTLFGIFAAIITLAKGSTLLTRKILLYLE